MSSEQDIERDDVPDAHDDSWVVRLSAVIATPFVIAGEAMGKVVLLFFGTAEKLNPMPLLQRIVSPLGDLSLRVMRAIRNPFRPVEKVFDRLIVAFRRVVSPWSARITDAVRRFRDRCRAFAQTVVLATEPVRAVLRRARDRVVHLWRRATAPARTMAAKIRWGVRRVRTRLTRS